MVLNALLSADSATPGEPGGLSLTPMSHASSVLPTAKGACLMRQEGGQVLGVQLRSIHVGVGELLIFFYPGSKFMNIFLALILFFFF